MTAASHPPAVPPAGTRRVHGLRGPARPSSARLPNGGASGASRAKARPHSARAGLFLPHPPAQQPPDAVGSSAARPTSAYEARFAYQKKIDRERETARRLKAEREEEQLRQAEAQAARKARVRERARTQRIFHDLPEQAGAEQEQASEPEDPVDEPTGSFRRRRAAHVAVMQSLRKENPQAAVSRAAQPLGHEWRDLNRGLNNLFRTRSQLASTANRQKKRSSMGGLGLTPSAPIPSLRQKALKRQMGVLSEFYQVGQAGRVLGEVDKSFVKRRSNPEGVTQEWAQEVDRKREQLAPWAASNPEAVFGKRTETVAQRRDRLRAELVEKRREREAKKTGDVADPNGAFTLRTNEHASLGLQLALQREARDSKTEEKLRDKSRPIGPRVPTNTESRVAACIVPLCAQAESKSVEVQRDVAAALYSLSIADENKPAFVEAQALETLIAMSDSKDPDVRRNIAGAMYRLSMCVPIKRPFVELGVLRPLLELAKGSKDREVQRYSIQAIKELCEKRANHVDIIDAHALPILFSHLESTDPRIRKEAIWTLDHLADDETNRLRMLRDGSLDIILQNLQAQDIVLRRGSASTLLKFAKLLEVAPADIVKQLNSKKTLSALIAALIDRDLDVGSNLCKALVIMKSARLTRMMRTHDGLVHVLTHASRLVNFDGTGEIHANLAQVMTVLLTFMPAKFPANVMVVMDRGFMSTLLHLCKYNSGKVRRSAGKLLARLSTIEAAKAKMMTEPNTVSLLNSLCKQSDYSSQMTAVKVIAELAEEPKNRLPLYLSAVLPTLFELIRKGDDEMRFQAARAIADMAEAVELRVAIVYAGLEQILECMLSEDDQVQEQGMRILVNLAAPAGFACGAERGAVGRYGALEAMHVDDDLDDSSSSSGASGESDMEEFDSDDSDDSDESDDLCAPPESDDSDGDNEDNAMDLIADMIDGLHGNDTREEAATHGVSGGLAGMALAASAGQEDDSSDEEEDDYDEVENEDDSDDAADGEEEQAAHRRSEVIQRAKLLVHKAAILEKERTLSKRNEEEDDHAPPVEPEQAVPPVAAMGPRVKKPKGAKAAPLTAGRTKEESNFSRYRRQSAHNIMEDRKKEELATAEKVADEVAKKEKKKTRARRLSVGWGDMATLLGPAASSAKAVDEQSDEWWSTEEGERVKLKHNTINVDRIHLKIAEANVVKRLLELVFDETPHVSEYAVAVISFMVEQGQNTDEASNN